MPKHCICYTTDQNYLFATLASALETKKYLSGAGDICIFAFGISVATQDDFKRICEKESINILFPANEEIENGPIATSRLFLNRFAPKQYSYFLYLDSDVQVVDKLDDLIAHDVPAGHFFAANDPLTFLLEDSDRQSRDLAAHISSLGLSPNHSKSYFNSGVLLINREGWDKIGEAAWDAYSKNSKAFRFSDQDALNTVAAKQRMQFSIKWNFPIFMRNFIIDGEIKPHILHFMSYPKPWHGQFLPWDQNACLPYSRLIAQYPALASYYKPMHGSLQIRYHLQQRYKRLYEKLTWGIGPRKKRIFNYELAVAHTLAEHRKNTIDTMSVK